MKCLSRLLFNVYADERETDTESSSCKSKSKCPNIPTAKQEAPTDKAAAYVPSDTRQVLPSVHSLRTSSGPLGAVPPLAGSSCMRACERGQKLPAELSVDTSAGARARVGDALIGTERFASEDSDDDWILLEHNNENHQRGSQLELHNKTHPIGTPAALLSQLRDESGEKLTVCDHHCHCNRSRRCSGQLRETQPKQTPTKSYEKAQHCRPANDTLVDRAGAIAFREALSAVARLNYKLKPAQQQRRRRQQQQQQQQYTTQIDQKETSYDDRDLASESSNYVTRLYRIGIGSEHSLSTRRASSNLPTATTPTPTPTTTTTTTTSTKTISNATSTLTTNSVTMDNTDIELIRASWKPARKDPVAAGALLFKGLFTKFPQYLKLFAQFSDLDLDHIQENKRLLKHALKVIDTVTYVVDTVGDETQTGQLNEALTDLVNSHLRRKIGLTEFRNLGIVLIDFVCDFNNSHNNELRIDTNLVAAWTKLYGSVLELVKRLEDEVLDDVGQRRPQSQTQQTEQDQSH